MCGAILFQAADQPFVFFQNLLASSYLRATCQSKLNKSRLPLDSFFYTALDYQAHFFFYSTSAKNDVVGVFLISTSSIYKNMKVKFISFESPIQRQHTHTHTQYP